MQTKIGDDPRQQSLWAKIVMNAINFAIPVHQIHTELRGCHHPQFKHLKGRAPQQIIDHMIIQQRVGELLEKVCHRPPRSQVSLDMIDRLNSDGRNLLIGQLN